MNFSFISVNALESPFFNFAIKSIHRTLFELELEFEWVVDMNAFISAFGIE